MRMDLIRGSKTPLYLQIKNSIKRAIQEGELAYGFKLPPERILANDLKVHRNTVIKAYRELVDEGIVQVSNKPRGYIIVYGKLKPFCERKTYREFSPFEYIVREEYTRMNILFNKLFGGAFKGNTISFAADIASKQLYPREELNCILKELMENEECDLYGYCPPQGLYELRVNISKLLMKRNIYVNPTELQIVAETYQAMDYLLKLFVSKGDVIIVEEPLSVDYFNAFRLHGANVVTIPVDNEGMITDFLEQLILKYKPKFIFTIPTLQCPTMTVMSLERRYRLLELSYKYNIPIIEEDCDSILQIDGVKLPSLKSLDKGKNVIYMDSFIFSAFPGARIGYVAAPRRVVEKMSQLLEMNQIFVNSISQYIISEFINGEHYDKHIEKVRKNCIEKRDLMCNTLQEIKEFSLEFEVPCGGTNIWCRLPDEVNQNKLLIVAHDKHVSFSPGYIFYPYGDQGENHIRLSYGGCSNEEIINGIELLKQAIIESTK